MEKEFDLFSFQGNRQNKCIFFKNIHTAKLKTVQKNDNGKKTGHKGKKLDN